MTRFGKKILLGACAMLASMQFAHAADAPVYETGDPPYVHDGGWYLRGDIGYVIFDDPVVTYANGAVDFSTEDFDDTWMIGGGIGYWWSSWLRTDLTFDWRSSDFLGGAPCGCGPDSVETATLDSWTIMWNVYAELGRWHAFSPYVGAGVGVAYNKIHGIVSVDSTPSTTVFPDGGKWNMAAALMAGVSYAISDRTVLDMGYRYIWMGEAESGIDASGNTLLYDDIRSHEIRIGLRYEFN